VMPGGFGACAYLTTVSERTGEKESSEQRVFKNLPQHKKFIAAQNT